MPTDIFRDPYESFQIQCCNDYLARIKTYSKWRLKSCRQAEILQLDLWRGDGEDYWKRIRHKLEQKRTFEIVAVYDLNKKLCGAVAMYGHRTSLRVDALQFAPNLSELEQRDLFAIFMLLAELVAGTSNRTQIRVGPVQSAYWNALTGLGYICEASSDDYRYFYKSV